MWLTYCVEIQQRGHVSPLGIAHDEARPCRAALCCRGFRALQTDLSKYLDFPSTVEGKVEG